MLLLDLDAREQRRSGDHGLKPCAWLIVLPALLFTLLFDSTSQAQLDDTTKQLSHDIFKQLIEINTTDSVGNVTTAAEAMAQRFRDAGFPDSDLHILGPNDRKKNLVVRLSRQRQAQAGAADRPP